MFWTNKRLFSPNTSAILATGVCVGAVLVKLLPNGPFLGNYKDVYQAYKNLKPMPLSESLQSRVQETLTAMKADDCDRALLDYFQVSTAEMFHAGSVHLRWGGVVGLPLTFGFLSPSDAAASGFSVYGYTIDWSSEEGRALSAALVLSPDAQRFAIARETFSVCGAYFFGEFLLNTGAFFGAFVLAALLNSTERFQKAPRIARMLNNVVVCLMVGVLWVAMRDLLRCGADERVDEKAARLGVSFCQGGIEFYRQMLARNSALREIIGDRDSSLFSKFGNRTFLVRTPNQPLTERLAHLRSLKAELVQEAERQSAHEAQENLLRQQELDALDSKLQ